LSIFLQVTPKAAIAALRGMTARRDKTQILKDISLSTLSTLLVFGEDDKITNNTVAEEMYH
jgi:hypothetical protein